MVIEKSELSKLAKRANECATLARSSAESTVQHAIEAGSHLIRAKEICGHGRWSAWLERNFEFGSRTAAVFMRVAREGQIGATSIRQCIAQIAEQKQVDSEKPNVLGGKPTSVEPIVQLSNRKRASDLRGVRSEPDGVSEDESVSSAQINGASTICDRLIDTLRGLANRRGGEWIDISFLEIEIRKIKSHIRGSVFAKKCCSSGCAECRGTGWLPRSRV